MQNANQLAPLVKALDCCVGGHGIKTQAWPHGLGFENERATVKQIEVVREGLEPNH